MREFEDHDGRIWDASVARRPGTDFKGRYYFVAEPRDRGAEERVRLDDVRWNSEKTALRTLRTMSDVELRRRLRSARGRVTSPVAGAGRLSGP